MENPFLDYGKIVTGIRFIGRLKEIAIIRNRVLNSSFGNIAVQGIPRIGKSSLVWNALVSEKEILERDKGIFVIRINVSSLISSEKFFMKLLKELHKRIRRNSTIKELEYFNQIFEKVTKSEFSSERYDLIEEYCQFLRDFNHRVIFILDEFDAARGFLNVGDFQFLRELTYNPDTEVCIVSISRRGIKEIEPSEGTLSNFYQTFNDLYVGMYSEDDMDEYWKRFFPKEISLSEKAISEITNFSGKHPFLLDLFNFHMYNNYSGDLYDAIINTKKSIKVTILNNYKTILDLLQEEGLASKLIQVVIGPKVDLKSEDVEKLERLDLINISETKLISMDGNEVEGFETFSNDFEQYLRKVNREIPIWDLWSETEVKLRNIVHEWLVERFGEEWVPGFSKLNPKKVDYIEQLQSIQARERQSFPDTYSQNLLDFTYPADLFNRFMSTEWKWFSNVFGGQKNDWKLKFDLLARIRNPLAHNKENLLKEFEKDDANGYCKEIIHKIDEWYKGKYSNE
ncbi:ATP-binding protein [Phaeodactylibacter xiamenensis]|uniref:ATP-binding protein n=1 Tax=Phaeodactylibacter xiamenensis TaxID=1524460 RepID=UPI003CCBA093